MMQGTLSGRCSTAWGQDEIPCHSKVLFPLVHACYKNMQHRSKHNPIIWAWRNLATLNFLSDIHWFNTIKYFKKKMPYFGLFLPNWIVSAVWRVCFQVLVISCCLMCKLGYEPYTHKTWSQQFFHNTSLYLDKYLYMHMCMDCMDV